MADAPVALQEALILAIHTGQRYGDLIRLRWQDYDGCEITLRQNKTGAGLTIPATSALKRLLDSMERRGQYVLTRPDGRPWHTKGNDNALSKAFHAHADAAGITNLRFHDLRGTAVVLMCAAGLEIPQVASITGHTMRSATEILERYGARNRAVARAAIERFENSPVSGFANRLQTKR